MSRLSHHAKRALLFWALCAFVVIIYVMPVYPGTVEGWTWMIGLSLPYCLFIGGAGHLMGLVWPPAGFRRVAILAAAVAAIAIATWAYFKIIGII